jgi:nucleotide-binding universal stress UspA family protein
MAIKDILVHVDNSRACPLRLGAALQLAEEQGAHLVGLYVLQRLEIPTYLEAEVGIDVLEMQREVIHTRARQAEELFRSTSERAGIAAEWRSVDGNLLNSLLLHGRYADLLIVGQGDASDPLSISAGLSDRYALEAGRPVLVIPAIGARQTIGKRVLVAWNASREATRSLHDALPFLERAEKVAVVSVRPPRGEMGNGELPGADICLHLARHGVTVEAQYLEARDIGVDDLLLSRAVDENIDLIVMGAYGHSRFRELVLGGTTRYMLRHMTVPLLLSH